MCPFWIPVVIKLLTAAKFWARPVDAMQDINFFALGFPRSSWHHLTRGWRFVNPPTVPKASGSLIENLNVSSESSDSLTNI